MTLRIWRGYPSLVLSLATQPRRLSPEGGGPAHEIVDANTLRSVARTLTETDLDRCRAAIEVLRELRPDAAPALLAAALPEREPRGAAAPAREPRGVARGPARRSPVSTARGCSALAPLLREHAPADARERAALVRVYARLQEATEPMRPRNRCSAPRATILHRSCVWPRRRRSTGSACGRAARPALRRVLGPALEQRRIQHPRRSRASSFARCSSRIPTAMLAEVGPGRPEWHARLGLLVAALFRPAARARRGARHRRRGGAPRTRRERR